MSAGFGGGPDDSGFSFGFSGSFGGFCGSDFLPCGLPSPSLWDILGINLPNNNCDFGPCGPGIPGAMNWNGNGGCIYVLLNPCGVPADNGGGGNLYCNPTTGICVPNSMAPGGPDPVKNFYKYYLCGNSPVENIGNYMLEGMTKGAIGGLFFGSETGPGAFVTGVAGATGGAAGGIVMGSGASAVCHFAGAYGPHS